MVTLSFGKKQEKAQLTLEFGAGRGWGIFLHYVREFTDWARGCRGTEAGMGEGMENLFLRGSSDGAASGRHVVGAGGREVGG